MGWKGGGGVTDPLEGSSLEVLFAMQLLDEKIPFEREYKLPGLRYRWDMKVNDLLIELNGGTWGHMGHSSGTGIQRDYDKHNCAVLAGYRPLLFTGDDVRSGRALEIVRRAM